MALAAVVSDTARASGEALLAWIPVAELGNPLPFGSALMLDEAGAVREVPVREFAFKAIAEQEASPDFEAALVDALAEWHEG